MTAPCKTLHVAVVVRTGAAERIDEALRAALGLTLRGDRVTVLATPVSHGAMAAPTPAAARCIDTLRSLGHRVEQGDDRAADSLLRSADAAEVWT